MNRTLVVCALTIASAIILGAALLVYFSPYQSCVRAATGYSVPGGVTYTERQAQIRCAIVPNPN